MAPPPSPEAQPPTAPPAVPRPSRQELPAFFGTQFLASISNPELAIQPLFPLALGQVQLRPDPLDTALQIQALHQLRGTASSNPDEGCAWTGDLNGVWQLHRQPQFAPLIKTISGHAASYLERLGLEQSLLSVQSER